MKTFHKHKKQMIISFITILTLIIFACNSKSQNANKRLNDNQKDCQTMTLIQSKFKSGFNNSKYIGKTIVRKIDNGKIKITQDTIQTILENNMLDFYSLLQKNLINTKIFIQDLDFLKNTNGYQKKELSNIKHTFFIFGIEELNCNELKNNIKRYKFHVCIGNIPSNGIIYYLEINKGLKKDEPDKLVYLQSFGITI